MNNSIEKFFLNKKADKKISGNFLDDVKNGNVILSGFRRRWKKSKNLIILDSLPAGRQARLRYAALGMTIRKFRMTIKKYYEWKTRRRIRKSIQKNYRNFAFSENKQDEISNFVIFNFINKPKFLIFKHLEIRDYLKIKKLKISARGGSAFGGKNSTLKRAVAIMTLIATLVFTYFQNINPTSGATFTFNQSQWQAAPTGAYANHVDDQSGFTDYASKAANISLTGGAGPYDSATLSSVSDSEVQTADADFNAGATDQTSVGGDSVSLASEPGGFGDGGDGAWTISSAKNINADTNGNGGRTCADGVSYNVTALTANTATLSGTPPAGCYSAGDQVMLLNLQGDGTNLTNVGNYEFLEVQSVSGNQITFTTNKTNYYGNGASDDTNIGTTAGDSWSEFNPTDLSEGVLFGNSLVYPGSGDYIYALKGASASFFAYSISNDNWTTFDPTDAPNNVNYGGSLVYPNSGDYIYAFRGGSTADFWAYSISNNNWTTLDPPDAPGNIYHGGSLVYPGSGDYIYAFQGNNSSAFWAYSISNNNWTTSDPADAPSTVYQGGALVYPGSGDYVYAFRGNNTVDFWAYSISNDNWTTFDPTNSPDLVNAYGGNLVYPSSGDYIYAFRRSNASTFWAYSISNDNWTTFDPADAPAITQGAMVYPNSGDYIYAFRGGSTVDFWAYSLKRQRVILQRVPQYTDVTIQSGGSLTANAWDGTKGGVLAFYASGTVDVESGGSVTMSEKGYRSVSTNGYQGESYNKTGAVSTSANLGGGGGSFYDPADCAWDGSGGAGGGYGTAGGNSDYLGVGGSSYGISTLSQLFLGSSGGSTSHVGGEGGGILYLKADTFSLTGNVYNNGETTRDIIPWGGGGGSGGSVYLSGNSLTVGTNLITATGGLGDTQSDAYCSIISGNGGAGRIHLQSDNISGTTNPTYASSSLPTTYYSSGTFTSDAIDTGQNVASWGNLTWNATLNGQTVIIKARTDADGDFSDATDWGSCSNITSGQALSTGGCATDGHRYVQYQASLSTSDPEVTPSLDDVTIGYSYYPTGQTIVSSWYDATDDANLLSKIIWDENTSLPSGTSIQFQAQTAPDSTGVPGTATGWQGPDGTSGTYFSNSDGNCSKVSQTVTCNVPAGISIGDGTDDRWIQYRAVLNSDGANAPQLDSAQLQYVVNANPAVANVSASQDSSGTINVTYDVSDSDSVTGTATIYFALDLGATLADNPLTSDSTTINLSGNYSNLLIGSQTIQIDQEQITCTTRSGSALSSCTRAANNTRASSHTQSSIVWFVNTAGNVSGDAGAGITLGNGKLGSWNIKADLDGVYLSNPMIRIVANDGQLANQVSLPTGATYSDASFEVDTKDPAGVSFTINNQTNELTIATPSDDSSYEMLVSNASNFAGATPEAFATPYTHSAMTADPATVYVRIIDAYGNYTDATATTPAKPENIVYYDISNAGTSEWREFIAWGAISPLQVGAGFAYYDIHRSTDGASYASVYQEPDRAMNYFTDTDLDTAETYYYKVASEDTDGNVSEFSSVVSDQPNGQGSADQTAPTITNATVSNLNTTSATITWDTDELADSSVGYSEDQSYLPEYGNASMVTSHSITLIGLSPDTTYYIRLKSRDAYANLGQVDYGSPGNNDQADFTFTTHPGPSISNVAIANASNEQATISWTTDIDSDTYAVYSDSVSGGALADPISVGTPDLVGGSAPFYHVQTVTGLTEGSTYYFYVESTDGSNNTATDSNGGSFYKLYTTSDNQDPVISGVNVAVRSNTEAAINWATDEDADSLVEYGTEEGGPYSDSGTVATYDASHYVILSGLSPNETYYYTVTSADINGNSAASAEYSFTTLRNPEEQHDPLSEITNVSDPPSVLTDTKAVVKFNTDQAGKCAIEFGTESGNYAEVPITESLYNYNHSMHLTGLIFSTVYYYQIACTDNLDNAVSSSEYSFTTSAQLYDADGWGAQGDTTAPEITNVSSGSLTGESATITWDTDEETNSSVAFGISSGTYESMASNYEVNSDSANYVTSHTVVINGLTPATKYYFKALSMDASGNITESSESTFTTKSPSSLSSIKVVSTALNEATITWETSKKTSSIVEYGLSEEYGEKKESSSMANDHSVSLSGLESGATYHFRVKGKDQDNNWFSSGDYTFEPKSPPQISGVDIADVTEHEAKVRFSTNVPTDALVTYTDAGNNENSGSQGKPDLAVSHEVELKNLVQGTTFSLVIKVRDIDGNETEQTVQSFTTGKDENPPKIDQVRTDSALSQNEKVQTIISWTTDELADTSLLYKEGQGGQEKEIKITDNRTLNHVAVITTFKPGTVYYFKVKSVDQSENTGLSYEYAILTPKKKENVVQLIINNFEQIFGWAKR